MRNFEQLIDDAEGLANRSMAADMEDLAQPTAQAGICFALIAIAGELHRMNEHKANEVEQRLDLTEARVERLANLAG